MEVPTKEEFNNALGRLADVEAQLKAIANLPPPPEWLTVGQAATMLNRCEKTVRDMANSGKLTPKRGSRKMEISYESIRDYNLRHTVKK